MDAEHRHELEENDLAESTTALIDRLRPHATTLAAAVAAAALAFAGWTWIATQREATRTASWDAMMTAIGDRSPEALDEVIRRYPDSPAALWAQMFLGDTALAEGSQLLFTDRPRGRQRLEEAAGFYQGLLAGRPSGLVAERATFGLAKTLESLGQVDEARRGYETLVAEYPATAFKGMADDRIASLSRESTLQWYAWFDEARPATAAASTDSAESAEPGAGTGADGP